MVAEESTKCKGAYLWVGEQSLCGSLRVLHRISDARPSMLLNAFPQSTQLSLQRHGILERPHSNTGQNRRSARAAEHIPGAQCQAAASLLIPLPVSLA